MQAQLQVVKWGISTLEYPFFCFITGFIVYHIEFQSDFITFMPYVQRMCIIDLRTWF